MNGQLLRTGHGEPVAISSTHGLAPRNCSMRTRNLPRNRWSKWSRGGRRGGRRRPPVTHVASSATNVGKSSFVNAILNEERLIVDSTPGTTRDAIDIEFEWHASGTCSSTRGMRKKAGIKKHVEFYSVSRSLRAVAGRTCARDDGRDGRHHRAGSGFVDYVQEQGTAMVLLWTMGTCRRGQGRRFAELATRSTSSAVPQHVPSLTGRTSRAALFKA